MTRPPKPPAAGWKPKPIRRVPGSFCMVGDFQQSIYHDRADLAHYRRVHEALVAAEAGEAVTFSVTFRLDQEQLDFVNATFGEILNDVDGQVKFVELEPRPKFSPARSFACRSPPTFSAARKSRRTVRSRASKQMNWRAG